MMTNRLTGKRRCVMIVEPDGDYGIRLADWLAAHGYQPVLVRSVDAALEALSDIRPDVVFVGRDHSESGARIGIGEILVLIQTLCTDVPVITIMDQHSEDLTPSVLRPGMHQLQVTPVAFTQIGHVLRSEVNLVTA